MANQLLDEISDMQIGADTPRPPASYANNWGNDFKVDIAFYYAENRARRTLFWPWRIKE